jgi:hypothetical protein
MESTNPFPWASVSKNAKRFVSALLIIYIGLQMASAIDADSSRVSIYRSILDQIKDVSITTFDFIRPFIEIIILVFILDWVIRKFDLNVKLPAISEWNVFNVILMIVVGSFVFSALRGLGGTAYLKDLALVVVGFYFGSFQRVTKP